MSRKNKVPSAPVDLLDPNHLFADDGRKREDAQFVGAKTPDTDADTEERPRRRRNQPQR
jgi:hypothetical protein